MRDTTAGRRTKAAGTLRWHRCCAWLALSGALSLMAQTAPHQHTAKDAAAPAQVAPISAPINLLQQPPKAATVIQRDNALSVRADNASLSDILRQVASATGMKLEGLGGDERVFGSFGPASAQDVLTSLLNGTHYNVLMVGALANGAPRQLVLMRKSEAGSQPPPPQPEAAPQRPSPEEEDAGAVEEPDGPQPAPSIEPAVLARPGVPEPVPPQTAPEQQLAPGQQIAPGQTAPGQQNAPGQQPGQPGQPQVRTPQQFLQQIQQQQDQQQQNQQQQDQQQQQEQQPQQEQPPPDAQEPPPE